MILIFSKDNEPTTTEVIKWLYYFDSEIEIIRLNNENIIEIILTNSKFKIITNRNQTIDFNCVSTVWYRRGEIKFKINNNDLLLLPINFRKVLLDFLKIEKNDIISIIYKRLNYKQHINDFSDNFISKVEILNIASKIGFKIPDYLITNKKNELLKFKNKQGRIITKPILSVFRSFGDDYSLQLFTTEITNDIIEKLPEFFFPSMFQKLIEKKYELRIVFLDELFFSMAIFSQINKKTSIDFRHYTVGKNDRWVPFLLSESLKNLLVSFIKSLKFNSGSIDIIVDKNNDYYFLEVNPVGQFGMVSKPCNYFIEKEFAKSLLNNVYNNDK